MKITIWSKGDEITERDMTCAYFACEYYKARGDNRTMRNGIEYEFENGERAIVWGNEKHVKVSIQ